MTCEAPIALATSKQTNPIGPVEREEINHMSVVELSFEAWKRVWKWVLNSHTEASLFNLISDILTDH